MPSADPAAFPGDVTLDNLSRMQRLGLIASADEWLQMRGLYNRRVHEYCDRPVAPAPAPDSSRNSPPAHLTQER